MKYRIKPRRYITLKIERVFCIGKWFVVYCYCSESAVVGVHPTSPFGRQFESIKEVAPLPYCLFCRVFTQSSPKSVHSVTKCTHFSDSERSRQTLTLLRF